MTLRKKNMYKVAVLKPVGNTSFVIRGLMRGRY
jgi:hypothetical protein